MTVRPDNPLGDYLRRRRARLDPAAFGFSTARRRTPGLRREEVAQRAHISPTWYTWLEQGRGGAPSADVLDRIARALALTEVEREHLFLIALGRPPQARYREGREAAPHLQRVLDAFEFSPAYLRTATWDIVAWNRAAAAVLVDYGAIAPDERNLLRLFFLQPRVRAAQTEWLKVARFLVAAFRADVARAGAMAAAQGLVDDLARASPEFAAIWRENDVRGAEGEIAKRLHHPGAGWLDLEYSVFAAHGRPDLDLVVLAAATPESAERIRELLRRAPATGLSASSFNPP
jgi:transcriptional regulator with XRE-family HTH domain